MYVGVLQAANPTMSEPMSKRGAAARVKEGNVKLDLDRNGHSSAAFTQYRPSESASAGAAKSSESRT